MDKFPVDAPKRKVIKTLEILGFQIVREREHISMVRLNTDGSKTPLTMPNHPTIKASTLRTICTQSGISTKRLLICIRKNIMWKNNTPLTTKNHIRPLKSNRLSKRKIGCIIQ